MNIYFIKHSAVVSSNHSSFTLQAVLWAYTQFQRKFGQFTLLWLEVVTIQKNGFFRSWVMDFFFVLVHVFVIRLIACIYFTDDDHAWFAYTSLLLRHRHWSRNRRDCRPFIMESGTARGAIAWLRWNTWQVNVFNDHGDLYVMLVDYMICTQWNRINLITSTQSSSKLVSTAWTEVHVLR